MLGLKRPAMPVKRGGSFEEKIANGINTGGIGGDFSLTPRMSKRVTRKMSP